MTSDFQLPSEGRVRELCTAINLVLAARASKDNRDACRVVVGLLPKFVARIRELEVALDIEQRKDHGYNAFCEGYDTAIADWKANRTAGWGGDVHPSAKIGLTKRLRTAESRIRELEGDAARLDELAALGCVRIEHWNVNNVRKWITIERARQPDTSDTDTLGKGDTLGEAIDAALSQTEKPV